MTCSGLQNAMTKSGSTIESLAKQSGFSTDRVTEIVNGNKGATTMEYQTLCKLLGHELPQDHVKNTA